MALYFEIPLLQIKCKTQTEKIRDKISFGDKHGRQHGPIVSRALIGLGTATFPV
jgi:hypothetical protein